MRNATALKGIAFLAAVLLMGAGCTSTSSVQTTPTSGTVNTNVQGGATTGGY